MSSRPDSVSLRRTEVFAWLTRSQTRPVCAFLSRVAPRRAGFSANCVSGNEGVMGRIRTIVQTLIGVTVLGAGMIALAPAAHAITIPVACSENALVAAVNLANSTSAGHPRAGGRLHLRVDLPARRAHQRAAGDHHPDRSFDRKPGVRLVF